MNIKITVLALSLLTGKAVVAAEGRSFKSEMEAFFADSDDDESLDCAYKQTDASQKCASSEKLSVQKKEISIMDLYAFPSNTCFISDDDMYTYIESHPELDVNEEYGGHHVLHCAVNYNHARVVGLMLRRGANAETQNPLHETALFRLATRKDWINRATVSIVRDILAHSKNIVHMQAEDKRLPLDKIVRDYCYGSDTPCVSDTYRIVKLLVDAGATMTQSAKIDFSANSKRLGINGAVIELLEGKDTGRSWQRTDV